jgi:hypothetical protein
VRLARNPDAVEEASTLREAIALLTKSKTATVADLRVVRSSGETPHDRLDTEQRSTPTGRAITYRSIRRDDATLPGGELAHDSPWIPASPRSSHRAANLGDVIILWRGFFIEVRETAHSIRELGPGLDGGTREELRRLLDEAAKELAEARALLATPPRTGSRPLPSGC